MSEPPHFRRILLIWIALSVIATPLVVLVAVPGLPPGNASSEASGQVADNTVLFGIATPIAALILVYFAYTLIVFRHRGPEPEEGVAIRGDNRVQLTWIWGGSPDGFAIGLDPCPPPAPLSSNRIVP